MGQHRKMGSNFRSDNFNEPENDCTQVDEDILVDPPSREGIGETEEINEGSSIQGISGEFLETSSKPEETSSQMRRPFEQPTKLHNKKVRRGAHVRPSDMVVGSMLKFLEARSQPTPPPAKTVENRTLMFFKSLVPDVEKLSEKRQRKFKEDLLKRLNEYVDEQENENYYQQSYSNTTPGTTPTSSVHTYSSGSNSPSVHSLNTGADRTAYPTMTLDPESPYLMLN